MKLHWPFTLFVLSLTIPAPNAHATPQSEEEELASAFGDRTTVSIATGRKQALTQAPATASVLTSKDFAIMGATTVAQALESVPGLHVMQQAFAGNSIYAFRGLATNFNTQVLMLKNGIPITDPFLANRTDVEGGMPLENVARIEVIRGPGSALYGSDAFSGVINIVTKTADDVKGSEYGVRLGNFNTRDAWVQYGGQLGAVKTNLYLRSGYTDYQKNLIKFDAQSSRDTQDGTHSSTAPGYLSASRRASDAHLDLTYEEWQFRIDSQYRKIGSFAGLGEALDDASRAVETRTLVDLTYNKANIAPNWNLTALVSSYTINTPSSDIPFKISPNGSYNGAFPEGVLGNPSHASRTSQLTVSTSYTGWQNHRLRLGTGYVIEDLYHTGEIKNYAFSDSANIFTISPLAAMTDVTGDPALVYLLPHKRNLKYLFVQDEWAISQDWALTAGVRKDQYSDFGGTTNPRLALVWNADYNLVIKALHGRAFRAPSFVEQYNINNPVTIGSAELRPERIQTSELVFAYRPQPNLQTNLTWFFSRARDNIQYLPPPGTNGLKAQNASDQTSRGMELEAIWDVNLNLRLSSSYSLQKSIDAATGKDAGLVPRQRLFLRADWRFAPTWQLGGNINRVTNRHRQPGDNRPKIADYTLVDASMRKEKLYNNWELKVSIQNLFNRDAREPSFAPGNIQDDLPLPGRTVYFQLQHTL